MQASLALLGKLACSARCAVRARWRSEQLTHEASQGHPVTVRTICVVFAIYEDAQQLSSDNALVISRDLDF